MMLILLFYKIDFISEYISKFGNNSDSEWLLKSLMPMTTFFKLLKCSYTNEVKFVYNV